MYCFFDSRGRMATADYRLLQRLCSVCECTARTCNSSAKSPTFTEFTTMTIIASRITWMSGDLLVLFDFWSTTDSLSVLKSVTLCCKILFFWNVIELFTVFDACFFFTSAKEVIIYSPCDECGSQSNHRMPSSLPPGHWQTFAALWTYCPQLTTRGPQPCCRCGDPGGASRLEVTVRKT